MPAAKRPKKTASGYKMPEHLPEGTRLKDLMKKEWTLGSSIGVGGFGEIYLAAEGTSKPTKDNAKHVVKIEPKENGPLFVEMHFYIQVGTADQMKGWTGEVNMPLMRGQGSYQHTNNDTYRFLVIDRFGTDLDKLFMNGKNPLGENSIGTAAVQIINTLQYIHSKGYTHNDVKAANLLFGLGKESTKLFLVDFGLCVKYIKRDGHKEYKADPRKAHDGTIEYLSRDAHIGCTSRRSDLEVLCFNLYHWYTGTLPWIKILTSPLKVEAEKKKFMSEVPANLSNVPKSIRNLFQYVKNLQFQEEPNYKTCCDFFKAEVKATGGKFILEQTSTSKQKTPKTKKQVAAASSSPAVGKNGTSSPAVGKKGRPGRAAAAAPIVELDVESEEDMWYTPPAKQPRNGVTGRQSRGVPQSARKTATPKAKPVTRYVEAGCQTSPGFVRAATKSKSDIPNGDGGAKRKASRASEESPDIEFESPTAEKPAAKKKSAKTVPKKEAKKPKVAEPATNGSSEGGMVNPTPAMLEIMRRKEEIAAEKAAKKRKK